VKSQRNAGRRMASATGSLDAEDEIHLNPWRNAQKGAWNAASRAEDWGRGFADGCAENRSRIEAHAAFRVTLWHATTREAAAAIDADGFQGSWGEAGFGVHLFTGKWAAEAFLEAGGRDGALAAGGVIVEVEADRDEIEAVEPDPGDPNAEDRDFAAIHRMDHDDDAEVFWTPDRRILETEIPCP
jgi:hypothetical protein